MTTIAGLSGSSIEEESHNFGKFMLHGPQGTGKTHLASTIAQAGPTLAIDFPGERGFRSIKDAPWAKNITVVKPTTTTEVTDIYHEVANSSHWKAAIFDSASAFQLMAVRWILGRSETSMEEITKGGQGMRIQDWGTLRDIMADLFTSWYGLADSSHKNPKHIVFTSQTRFPNQSDDDEADRFNDRATLEIQGGGRSFALSTPDYVLYTETEPDLDASPDQDGELPQRYLLRIASSHAHTKARIPVSLRGKIPFTLGRSQQPLSLVTLGRVLDVGGMGSAKKGG